MIPDHDQTLSDWINNESVKNIIINEKFLPVLSQYFSIMLK